MGFSKFDINDVMSMYEKQNQFYDLVLEYLNHIDSHLETIIILFLKNNELIDYENEEPTIEELVKEIEMQHKELIND